MYSFSVANLQTDHSIVKTETGFKNADADNKVSLTAVQTAVIYNISWPPKVNSDHLPSNSRKMEEPLPPALKKSLSSPQVVTLDSLQRVLIRQGKHGYGPSRRLSMARPLPSMDVDEEEEPEVGQSPSDPT
jgi:hypothetical protein